MSERNGRKVEMRLRKLRGARHRDVGMNVDGDRLRPRFAAGTAVLARRGWVVVAPDFHSSPRLRIDWLIVCAWSLLPYQLATPSFETVGHLRMRSEASRRMKWPASSG